MITKILCPVDGTTHSHLALISAIDLAGKYGAELSVCVINILHGGGRGPMTHHWTDAEAEKILMTASAEIETHGLKPAHTTVVISREAAIGIVSHAEDIGADHIVMGTGDKRGFSRLMLGSVAQDVAARAHCSVTIAR